MRILGAVVALCALIGGPARAATTLVEIRAMDVHGAGHSIGVLQIMDEHGGLLLRPRLAGLPPGVHRVLVLETAVCGGMALPAGGAMRAEAGRAGKRDAPAATDFLPASLPTLEADASGKAMQNTLAPGLNVESLRGHALVVMAAGAGHEGARIACGIVR